MIRAAVLITAALLLTGCVSTVVGTTAGVAAGATGAVVGAGVKTTGKVAGGAGRAVFLVQPTE